MSKLNFWLVLCVYSPHCIFHNHSDGPTRCLDLMVRRESSGVSAVCVDCNSMESCRFKKCHLLLVSSPLHNAVSGDTPDYLCSARVSSDPLSVYLKDPALLTGLFKCPDTLGQNLSAGRAGWHPEGPVFIGWSQRWKWSGVKRSSCRELQWIGTCEKNLVGATVQVWRVFVLSATAAVPGIMSTKGLL